jgi:hypothetical protein
MLCVSSLKIVLDISTLKISTHDHITSDSEIYYYL